MQVKILGISKSTKPSILASVRLEISSDSETIIIDDARVLRNKQGQVWLAMPSYSVQLGGGRFDYQPAITLSLGLKRAVEDVALPAFEAWEKSNEPAR